MTTKNNNIPTIKLEIQNNEVLTTSNQVAEIFGKQHKNIIQSIQKLDCSDDFMSANFSAHAEKAKMPNGGTRETKSYQITKDGFTFLAMGFTGKKAAGFKEAYIKEFNRMANSMNNLDNNQNQNNNPTPLEFNKRKFLKIEKYNDECYFLTSEFANMFDIDHDKLMDEVSIFANTYKNHYSSKYLKDELIVFTARNKKQQALIHHSVFLMFANKDKKHQHLIIGCIHTIEEFHQKQKQELEDKATKIKDGFNKGSYYVGHAEEIITKNLGDMVHFNNEIPETCLEMLSSLKQSIDKDDPRVGIISGCEALIKTSINQNKLQFAQIKVMVDEIYSNIHRSEMHLFKISGDGNATQWMVRNTGGKKLNEEHLLRGFE
jgi:Rha family phage regulatory protein